MRGKILGLFMASLVAIPALAQPGPPPFGPGGPPPIPPPRFEHRLPPPGAPEAFIWEDGHWRWDGYRYVWIEGHWIERRAEYHHFTPGHWSPPGEGPPHWVPSHWE